MFVRMRSGSTVSPSIAAASAASPAPAVWTAAATVGHSACQPPTARSCSCTMPLRYADTSDGIRVAAARVIARGGRVALVRQRRRAAAGLGRFTDFVLHQQRHVAGDLAKRAGVDAERRDECREAVAVGVPRRRRRREPELLRKRRGDVEAAVAHRRERAGGAAELDQHRALVLALDAGPAAPQRRDPVRRLEAESGRRRRLQQRPREHDSRRVFGRELRQRGVEPSMIGSEDRAGLFQREDQRGIGNVLAGRAPVDEPRRVVVDGADVGAQRPDQRNRDRRVLPRLAREARGVEVRGPRGRGDRLCRASGNDAELRLRLPPAPTRSRASPGPSTHRRRRAPARRSWPGCRRGGRSSQVEEDSLVRALETQIELPGVVGAARARASNGGPRGPAKGSGPGRARRRPRSRCG